MHNSQEPNARVVWIRVVVCLCGCMLWEVEKRGITNTYEGDNKIDVLWEGAPRQLLLHDIDLIVHSGDTFPKQAERMLTSARHVDGGP